MYNHVVMGGTFDHLHVGHIDLLNFAFSQSKKVTLGLTKISMNTRKELASQIQSFGLRQKALVEYAKEIHREKDLSIIAIDDVYGSTLQDASLEAIIVTPHTLAGAHQINIKREEIGLPKLDIQTCDLRTDDEGVVISSSRIRRGEINREGLRYAAVFQEDIKLTAAAKEILRRPIGKAVGARVLKEMRGPLIIVGDISTAYCISHNVRFTAAYIDGRTKHHPYELSVVPPYTLHESSVENTAGTISQSAAKLLSQTSIDSTNAIYKIDGEEDLLSVAAVVLLPIGSHTVYGYPYSPQSMRVITVTERTKVRFASLCVSIK